ncbi:hypothetical protein BKA67DRAFT_552310 [Truncatella angustata]|uniref:F-box domain-containing protein n=1 Tax=Truncatella angustata TaxID=152316 RepID=A0A9P9A0X3_9PEZI|nr:uncharacterized protein BKA67DRAFT_552310 [Truncatella angustata]KAH6656556.1 hypothetical protein BKA67DRAFT_552310 [Truncatella angustata]
MQTSSSRVPTSAMAGMMIHIPELLEIILLRVDMRTLLVSALRVSMTWHTMITESHRIQRQLFFRADPTSKPQHNTLLQRHFPFVFEHAEHPNDGVVFIVLSEALMIPGDDVPFPDMHWLTENEEIESEDFEDNDSDEEIVQLAEVRSVFLVLFLEQMDFFRIVVHTDVCAHDISSLDQRQSFLFDILGAAHDGHVPDSNIANHRMPM